MTSQLFSFWSITFCYSCVLILFSTSGVDFSGPAPAVVTFLENDGPTTTRNTIFTIIDDSISGEPDETIEISGSSLSTAGRFAQNGDTATITIIDDGENATMLLSWHC